jgi:hypothetical protein
MLSIGCCRRKMDEEKASGRPLSRAVPIEECRRVALKDKLKTQGMLCQGFPLCKLRKTIQKGFKADCGPASCIVVEKALEDMSQGPVKDLPTLVLGDPNDLLMPRSHLLNGHVCGKVRSLSVCWFDWVIMFFCSHAVLILFHRCFARACFDVCEQWFGEKALHELKLQWLLFWAGSWKCLLLWGQASVLQLDHSGSPFDSPLVHEHICWCQEWHFWSHWEHQGTWEADSYWGWQTNLASADLLKGWFAQVSSNSNRGPKKVCPSKEVGKPEDREHNVAVEFDNVDADCNQLHEDNHKEDHEDDHGDDHEDNHEGNHEDDHEDNHEDNLNNFLPDFDLSDNPDFDESDWMDLTEWLQQSTETNCCDHACDGDFWKQLSSLSAMMIASNDQTRLSPLRQHMTMLSALSALAAVKCQIVFQKWKTVFSQKWRCS